MRTINYKSAFDFVMRLKDASAQEIPWPECDWDVIFWTSNNANPYRASCIGGVYVNCFREADGSIHFVFKSHRMGKGTLQWEPHFRFPNDIYPDGIQDQFRKAQLGIELVDGDGDEVTDIPEVEVYMPAVYLTAYDLAVRNGYTGTYEDYVTYTNRFPQVVETAETVNALLSDFADGKALIADALTRQGVDTASDESMQTMADKVLGLQLAVEGDPQYVEHDSRVGGYDLYNVMHNHKKAEYPYMYAVSFNAPTVTLSGADAYLCSDGYYTEQSGIHKMSPAQEHYVIYYFRNRSFTLTATAARFINEMCVYNGAPIVNFDRVDVRRLAVYGDEPFSTDNINAFRISGGNFADIAVESLESGYLQIDNISVLSLRMPNFKVLKGGTIFSYLQSIQSAMLPALESITGGTVVNNAASLAELSLPALETVSGGTIVNGAASLAELSLPALETVSGGTIVNGAASLAELSLPALTTVSGGYVANSCAALTELALPALTTVSGGTVAVSCHNIPNVNLPALKSIDGGITVDTCRKLVEVSMPVLTTLSGGRVVNSCQEITKLELPELTEILNGAQIAVGCKNISELTLPKLKIVGGVVMDGGEIIKVLSLPSVETVTSTIFYNVLFESIEINMPCVRQLNSPILSGVNKTVFKDAKYHFGAPQGGSIIIGGGFLPVHDLVSLITIMPGFRSSLDIRFCTGLSADVLRDIIVNLGDNTSYPTIQITFGTTNLAKLSEEDIALAVAKNYSLS